MSGSAVSARGVSSGYHGRAVIRDLDLEVRAGDIIGLFGANGAGKTTALLTLAGEITPLRGRIELFGRPHPGRLYEAARRGVALLTDDRAILGELSVRDNLRLGRGPVADALKWFPELEPHLGRRAALLSGGQQQMLSLARILAARPSLILADELSLGLAPIIVRRLLAALRAAANDGAAIVLVEQHVPLALGVVDRACVLVHGEVRLEDDAASLRDHPERVSSLYLDGDAGLGESTGHSSIDSTRVK